MRKQAIVGVDIGTTSTKAVAFGITGHVLFQEAKEYPLLSPGPGTAELDPEQVLEAVLETLGAVIRLLHQAAYKLEGVSFSSAMHGLMAVDAHGNKLTNLITWADTRSREYVAKLKSTDAGHHLYLHTGTPLHPMSPLFKLCWLRDHQPEIFRKAGKFIGIKEYVLFRLFGKYKTDYSVASATGLFNLFNLDWHPEALKIAGITKEQLPEPVPPTYSFRNLNASYATLLQLPPEVPFIIGASDGCLANLSAHAVRAGEAVVTIGTSGAIRVMANKPVTDLQERLFSYVLNEHHYVIGGSVNNGGVALRWFRDNFYTSETAAARQQDIDTYALLCDKAATIPAGADGLLCLPYLLGERAPIWDAAARACFIGAHYTHTREHFLRALMEGVIFTIYHVGRALEQTNGPVACLYANGGFSRSEVWVQMLADVFNKEVHLTESPEGSAFGAALLGMHALGILEKLEDAGSMIRVKKTYKPDPELHQLYMQSYTLFESLYPKLKDTFGQIANFHPGTTIAKRTE
ncbi:gluconokinase [Pontibacter ruber]|uniref:Gluconokinase n=1 Tax=Pontibacter ruber TaxID=1343895 RepID=A0ABW5D0T0_9BACT|nr:gluconokinase [Pontibacter ruber]